MTPSKKIFNLFGNPVPKTLPTQEEVTALPKLENGQPDFSKMPNETVGNLILAMITNYPITDKKDIFAINAIGGLIMNAAEGESFELKDKLRNFLLKVIDWATIRTVTVNGKEEQTGMYFAWATGQVLADLGVQDDDDAKV